MMGNKSEVKIGNVENSEINVKVTQILSKSLEYNELLDQLKTQQKLFDRTPEDEQQERLEISAKINELTNRIEQFKEDVLRLAEQFQRIEINTDRLKRAKEFFDKGEFGEARAVLECELEQMQDENKRMIQSREHFEQDILPKLINNSNEFFILALSSQINYDNPNWFVDTCNYFEYSINVFATKDNVFKYAGFLKEHNEFDKAESFYKKCLVDFADELSMINLAILLNSLAILYHKQNKYLEALDNYEKSLNIRRILSDENPNIYLGGVSELLVNIGNLYSDIEELDKAMTCFKEASDILRVLVKENPEHYLSKYAISINNMATLFQDVGMLDDALKIYEDSLSISKYLAENDVLNHLPQVAITLNNIGSLYKDKNETSLAIIKFNEALILFRYLAKNNPLAYLPDIATLLNNLATCHFKTKEIELIMKYFEESNQIYFELIEKNVQVYSPFLARNLGNLSLFYQDYIPQREKSIDYAIQSVNILLAYEEIVPFAQPFFQTAMAVLEHWNLTDEEIEQLIAEKMDENGEN